VTLLILDIGNCVEGIVKSVCWGVPRYHDQITYFVGTFLEEKHVWAMREWVCGV
jgi:hypothetical protein